jgi:hypothetical protein
MRTAEGRGCCTVTWTSAGRTTTRGASTVTGVGSTFTVIGVGSTVTGVGWTVTCGGVLSGLKRDANAGKSSCRAQRGGFRGGERTARTHT